MHILSKFSLVILIYCFNYSKRVYDIYNIYKYIYTHTFRLCLHGKMRGSYAAFVSLVKLERLVLRIKNVPRDI